MITTWFPCRKSFTFQRDSHVSRFRTTAQTHDMSKVGSCQNIVSFFNIFGHDLLISSHMCRMGRLNIYRPQHGTPVDFFSAMAMDPENLQFVQKKTTHLGLVGQDFISKDTTTFKLLVSCAASRYPRDSKRWIPGAIWSLDVFQSRGKGTQNPQGF